MFPRHNSTYFSPFYRWGSWDMGVKSLAQDDTWARSGSGFRAEAFILHSLCSGMKMHKCNFNLFTCITSQWSWKAKLIIAILYLRKLGLREAHWPGKCLCTGLSWALHPTADLALPRGHCCKCLFASKSAGLLLQRSSPQQEQQLPPSS